MRTKRKAEVLQGTVGAVEVVHHEHFSTFEGYSRNARIVVWATTTNNEHVWVRTVEGGLDSLNISIKIAMAQEFFKKLVGHEIHFHGEKSHGETVFFVERESLPAKFLAPYSEIKSAMWSWVETNHAKELGDLRKGKAEKAAATRKRNAETKETERKRLASVFNLSEDATWKQIEQAESEARKKQEEELRAQEENWQAREKARRAADSARRAEEDLRRSKDLEERIENAPHLCFKKGRNPKYGNDQWEARCNGRIFILRREDSYDPLEKEIPVKEIVELVPGRIVLVQRLT